MRPHGLRSDAWFGARRLGRFGNGLRELLLRGLPERERLVGPSTDACIDGFPRSANTLAYHAFITANPRARVAHHLHTPIQVVRAVELGVPCAVTIRSPVEAISSFLVFWESIAPGRETPANAIRRYVDFYERVAEVRDDVVICTFERIVADPMVIARELNRKFGTNFRAQPLDRAGKGELISTLEQRQRSRGRDPTTYTVPGRERSELKAAVQPAVRSHLALRHAEKAFELLVGESPMLRHGPQASS